MKDTSVIIVTRLKPPHKPLVCKSIPPNVERILVYGGVGSNGRCKNLGAKKAHKPILIFMDDDIEFYPSVLQRTIEQLKTSSNLIITLGWRQWEAPSVLMTHRETFDEVKFDTDLYLLESLDFLLRAERKGFNIDTPKSRYDGHQHEFYDLPKAWFWYQFNQAAFMLKHKRIPQNAFNPHQKRKTIIKPHKFFFNPTTVKGIPTLYKSRRLLCRWMGALYYGTKKLLE